MAEWSEGGTLEKVKEEVGNEKILTRGEPGRNLIINNREREKMSTKRLNKGKEKKRVEELRKTA